MSTVLLALVIVAVVVAVLAVPVLSLWSSISLYRSTRALTRATEAHGAAAFGQPPSDHDGGGVAGPPVSPGEPEERPAA